MTDEEKLAAAQERVRENQSVEKYNRRATQPLDPRTPDQNLPGDTWKDRAKGAMGVLYNGMAGALAESAFVSFGDAFEGGGYTPRGMRPDTSYREKWRERGAKVAQALENRWHAAEAEQYKKDILEPFQKNLEQLTTEGRSLDKMLQNGRWQEPDGTVVQLDMNNPEDVAAAARYRAQLERDLTQQITESHTRMNMDAALKYPNNPIVADIIQKMMEGAAKIQGAQFPAGMDPMAQAKDISDLRSAQAERSNMAADTRLKERELAQPLPFKSMAEAYKALGPAKFEEWLATAEGAPLLAHVAGPIRDTVEAEYIDTFRTDNGIPVEKWYLPETLAAQEDMLRKRRTEIEAKVKGRAIQQAIDENARRAVNDSSERNITIMDEPKTAPPPKITSNPKPSEMKTYRKRWEVLALDAGQRYWETEGYGKSKEEVIAWVKNSWYPVALADGRDILTVDPNTGEPLLTEQLFPLRADPEAKATKSYVSHILNSINKRLNKSLKEPKDDFEGGQRLGNRASRPGFRGAKSISDIGKGLGLFDAAPTYEEAFGKEEDEETPRTEPYKM